MHRVDERPFHHHARAEIDELDAWPDFDALNNGIG